jgi:hypothetical protein
VLSEFSFLNRIDTDLTSLYLISSDPTGHPILDRFLKAFEQAKDVNSIQYWLSILLEDARQIEAHVLEQLVAKNIVSKVNEKVFWVLPTSRYPVVDPVTAQDIESRLRHLILTDTIPDPRETVLISLANSCGLLQDILSPREWRRSQSRIEQLIKLDTVARELSRMIQLIEKVKKTSPKG